MKAFIVGAGAVGFQIARQLIAENRDVVVIERDATVAEYVNNRLDCMVVNDYGNNVEVLRRAGCDSADFFISVTGSDEINMIACAMASSEFERPRTIARVRNIDYSSTRMSRKSFMGIDYIVNPEIEAATALTRAIERGAMSDVMLFEETHVQIRSVTVDQNSIFRDKTLEEVSANVRVTFLVAVVLRQQDYIIPSGNTLIREGDVLYIVATEKNFEYLFSILGKHRQALNKVIIVGGGRIGTQVAEHLIYMRKNEGRVFRRLVNSMAHAPAKSIKFVERDYAKCKQLTERFPEALTINADISDEGVFEEEHFQNSDLVVATTDNQEMNIVTAIYAKSMGIKRAVVLVNKASYVKVASNLGIDVAVSLKHSTVNSILKFIRSGNVRSVHSISDGKVEIIEISVDEQSRTAGKKIQDIKLPRNALIVSVIRNKEHIVPSGNFAIEPHDRLIVIANKEHIDFVQELFSPSS
jgi:trk system potassium uptake protein TrkA